jgi:phosphate-selective porin
MDTGGAIRSLSAFVSVYLTGEQKQLANGGWKTPRPKRPLHRGGPGAWEILFRYSRTWTDGCLFDGRSVSGFPPGAPALDQAYTGGVPGAGNTLTVSVLEGAHDVHEFTLGLSWTPNPMVRLLINDVFLWAPAGDRDGDGTNDNLRKHLKTRWENALMFRVILKI